MRILFFPVFLLCVFISLYAKTTLTLEQIFSETRCTSKGVSDWKWIPGEKAISVLQANQHGHSELYRVDAVTGKETLLARQHGLFRSAQQEKRFTLPSYIWFPDASRILVPHEYELYILDIPNGSPHLIIQDTVKIRDPVISPDGQKIAYLKSGNLFCFDLLSEQQTQLTHNHDPQTLIGQFDYVYEEEFGIRTGYHWSHDGSMLAFFEIDISKEPYVGIPVFLNGQDFDNLSYPRAGQPNAIVRLGIVSVADKDIQWLDLDLAFDDYIPRITWHPGKPLLYINVLNRDQNRLELISVEFENSEQHTVLVEKNWDSWLDGTRVPYFPKNEKGFVWLSSRDGYRHLYLHSLDGELIKQLTRGQWEVDEILGDDNQVIYFSAFLPHRQETQLWSLDIDSGIKSRLSLETGTHDVHFSDCGKVYFDEFSSVDQPDQQWLQRVGQEERVWLNKGELESCPKPNVEFIPIANAEGDSLDGWIIMPDRLEPNGKYGVLIYTYGGPESRIVRDYWFGRRGLWYHHLNELGIIVIAADGRGTARRGRQWRHQVYRRLGQLEASDQVAVAEYARSLPFVDPERIAIWGWSYGGYNALRACIKGGGFKTAISVAPVTDWRLYDTIYTERYMDQPDDNPLGYEAGSVLDHVNSINNPLLLIHGTGDDNVHFSHTMHLAHELQQRGKSFEIMVYPDKRHGIKGTETQLHLYRLMTNHILKHIGPVK
jgi:dipeptidyl-peptidase-4